MNMHILVVVNGLSRSEESSILTLRKYFKKQKGDFRVDLLFVVPTKPFQASEDSGLRGNVDVREEPTRIAKLELSRCANLFSCADSQQWIAMGNISQESMTLAKKLHAQSILMSDKENASSVHYAQCLQLPRTYSIAQYVNLHCVRTGGVGFIFDKEVVFA